MSFSSTSAACLTSAEVIRALDCVGLFLKLLQDNNLTQRKHCGGCLRITPKDNYLKTLLLVVCGQIDMEKLQKYADVSAEKVTRTITEMDLSSAQSRTPADGMWGGAIIAGNLCFSFSGLEERNDHAMMLLLALELNKLSHDDINQIHHTLAETWPEGRQAYEALIDAYQKHVLNAG